MDQHVAAWEQLAALRKEFPDDPKLGEALEQLLSKEEEVATFTQALNKARDFEERKDKQVGSALSWYLKARSIYPRSEMAEAGIQRMLEDILPERDSKAEAKEDDDE